MSFQTGFTLSVGASCLQVSCDEPQLRESLCRRYGPFVSAESGAVDLKLSIQVQRKRLSEEPTRHAFFENGGLRFQDKGFEGSIDPLSRIGDLKLSTCSPVEDADYFLRVACSLVVFRAGGLLVHAAGIVRDGQGYLFSGPSGAGKSTVARISSGDRVLNDDLIVLLPDGPAWRIHGTPFWKPDLNRPSPGSAPLAALFRLVQAETAFVEPMEPALALAELVSSVPVISSSVDYAPQVVDRCLRLLSARSMHRLHFRRDASFWPLVEALAAKA